MKSYLRFLSRNKLYTAIEVVGLSLALAFVIILSSYILDDMSVNKSLKNTDDIYICHFPNTIYTEHAVLDLFEKIPDIEEYCTYTSSYSGIKRMFTGVTSATYGQTQTNVSFMGVGNNYFEMFTFPLISGDPKNPFPQKNSVIISEEMSRMFFPDGDAVGKSIHLFEENALKAYNPSCKDLDIDLTVAGIFKPFAATVFNEPDIIISYDYYNELLDELHGNMLSLFDLGFVRIKKGSDIEAVKEQLTQEYHNVANSIYGPDYKPENVLLTPFDDIKLKTEEELEFVTAFFSHLRNGKLFGIYLIMCIFVTIVALLGYVVLTIAFSRFRIKEIATRQLLGTSRRGIIVRCFCEALTLLLVSLAFAVVLVLAFKEPVGEILGKAINPLSQLNEYLVLLGIIILMVSIASSVPSIILSSYSPVNIIKGEARYKDKTLYGKIFVAIAGFLSIAALSICLAITSQTRHLINQDLGYEVDDVVFVRFYKNGQHLYLDELRSLPFVTKIGRLTVLPTTGAIQEIVNKAGDTEELLYVEGDREYFDVLGIDFLEEYSSPVGEDNIYLCRSTKESLAGFLNDNSLSTPFGDIPVRGVINDLKIGKLKSGSGRLTGINVVADFSTVLSVGDELCLKVDGNIQDGVKKIREFYSSKSYDDSVVYVDSLKSVQEYEIKEERNILKLITAFSICSLLMTIMTIIGLSSYLSKTREKDNAVRSIFGCSKRELVSQLVIEFVLPIVISALAAIPVAYMFVDSWLSNYVIRIANSPMIYLAALAAVMVIVIIVIAFQASRMMSTNPSEALKKE